jgi:tRNA modification GTPase
VVLAGPPNAGKSSLLNVLAQQDTAIVSTTPGTTRDVLRERIDIDGMPMHVLDTAGLRESGDALEAEGMRRARAAMERSDRILLVIDDNSVNDTVLKGLLEQLPARLAVTIIRNKIDLTGRAAGAQETQGRSEVALSAKTGDFRPPAKVALLLAGAISTRYGARVIMCKPGIVVLRKPGPVSLPRRSCVWRNRR